MPVMTDICDAPFTETGQMAQQGAEADQMGFELTPNEQPSPGSVIATHSKQPAAESKNVAKPATRPVNSFMMFRTYYNAIFGNAVQKEISPILTFLWKNDPTQNKWAILAKAYSIIRDAQGKALSPTDAFLRLNAPFMNMPMPTQYLFVMGWLVSSGTDARIVRVSTNPPTWVSTNHTVRDIIQHSIDNGFVQMENLSARQFDMMMVKADGREPDDQVPVPRQLNYTIEGNGEPCAGTDFDPFCDPFYMYNVSETFV